MHRLLLFFTVMAAPCLGYAGDVSKAPDATVRMGGRILTYLHCLRGKATPQERRLAAELIKKDGPIIAGCFTLVGGGAFVAAYLKRALRGMKNSKKCENSGGGSAHGSFESEDFTDEQKEIVLDTVEAFCNGSKNSATFTMNGKQVAVAFGSDDNHTLQLTINAEAEKYTLDCYPDMQSVAQYLAQAKNANVNIVIKDNSSGARKSRLLDGRWVSKDVLIS